MDSKKRIIKEYARYKKCDLSNTDINIKRLEPKETDIYSWNVILKFPEETPYKEGLFDLLFSLKEDYPLSPPKVIFITRICHPNINFKTGEVCLDVLAESWSPAWCLESICRAIVSLIQHPEPNSPLNCDAGYNSLVKLYTELYAKKNK